MSGQASIEVDFHGYTRDHMRAELEDHWSSGDWALCRSVRVIHGRGAQLRRELERWCHEKGIECTVESHGGASIIYPRPIGVAPQPTHRPLGRLGELLARSRPPEAQPRPAPAAKPAPRRQPTPTRPAEPQIPEPANDQEMFEAALKGMDRKFTRGKPQPAPEPEPQEPRPARKQAPAPRKVTDEEMFEAALKDWERKPRGPAKP